MKITESYNIGVPKFVLLFLAGFMWAGVGIWLLIIAHSLLAPSVKSTVLIYVGMGVGLALIMHHFVFLKIADKNLKRIHSMKGKNTFFSFISWKTYLIIPVMILIAVSLRHSSLPNQYLAIVYIGIGLAKFLSSIRYMRFLIKEVRK